MSIAAPSKPQTNSMFVMDLGNGLELWRVPVKDLREQDENARFMPKPMFERLTKTVSRDKRLESFPFCGKTERGIEIISGHHRVRSATAAKVPELFVIVDVTGLSRDQIRAKQLAHNSIEGFDNDEILAKIYSQIGDEEARLEAFMGEKFAVDAQSVDADVADLEKTSDYRVIGLSFLPGQREQFEKIATELNKLYDALYLAEFSQFEPFCNIVKRTAKEYDIRSIATVLAKMSEIVGEQLGIETEPPKSAVYLRDLFGVNTIPAEAAKVIKDALLKMRNADEVTDKNKWQALEYWAADYNAGR